MLVLLYADAGDYLALDDELGVGYGPLRHGDAAAEPHRLAPYGPGDGQLVIAQGRRGRLEAGADLYGGVHAYGHGDGQGPPQLLRALGHGPDVAAAGLQEDGQLVPPLDAQPVDGDVGAARVRVRGVAHAESDVGSRVHGRIRRRGQEPKEVKIRLRGQVYDLLAGRGRLVQHRGNGRRDALAQQPAEVLLRAAQQARHALPAGQDAYGRRGAGVALEVFEEHRRTVRARGPLDSTTRADVAVDARELRRGVHLHLRLYQLPLHPAQKLQRGAQVAHGRVFAFDCHIPAPFRPGGRVSSPPQCK